MTYFLNFRARTVGGPVNPNPQLYQSSEDATNPGWALVPDTQYRSLFAGKSVLFVAHGFNVTQANGLVSLGMLGQYLKLPSPYLFVGVLWPGDSVIPIVDYPFEGGVAIDCGQRLATFCNTALGSAQSISFASHSLGARLVLEAVVHLKRKAKSMCLAAGAINNDCLSTQYAAATKNVEQVSLLASQEDYVLKVAFAAGDPFADLLNDDHTPFETALGLKGPATPAPPQVTLPWQISDSGAQGDYGHSDYLPPSAPDKWPRVADFMKRALLGQPQAWP